MLKRIKIGELIEMRKAHSQTGPFGTQLSAAEYAEHGIPVINVRNIGFGDVRKTDLEYVNDEKALTLKSHRLRKNDIVFGRKGAVERHALITDAEDGWIQGSDCIRLRFLTDEFDPTFISFFFRTESHKQWMINLGSFGATMPSLNQEIISKIEIPDIHISIQQKIASILFAYDELIENNKQRIKLLEEMAEEIYKEWFVRFRFPGYESTKFFNEKGKEVPNGTVGALPKGWENGTLGEMVLIKKGQNITSGTVVNGNIPVVAGGLQPAYYHNKANLIAPCITVSASGANAGFVNIYYTDIWASDCSVIDSTSTDTVYFFYLTLKTRQVEVTNLQKGSAQPHVYPKDIMGLKSWKPSVNVVQRFEKLITLFFKEIALLNEKNKLLQQTRDLLLPRLISGKLSVEHLIDQESEPLSLAAEPSILYGKD